MKNAYTRRVGSQNSSSAPWDVRAGEIPSLCHTWAVLALPGTEIMVLAPTTPCRQKNWESLGQSWDFWGEISEFWGKMGFLGGSGEFWGENWDFFVENGVGLE